jgi:hypothetical protein
VNKSVLVVQKGFQTKCDRFQDIIQQDPFKGFEVEAPDIPEPFDDIETCISTISASIQKCAPKLIVASSRGGKIIAQLVARNIFKGPFLLISITNVIIHLILT